MKATFPSALLVGLAMAIGAIAAPTSPAADSLASIDHVILFMQENRAFDHYYGSMAGVRGFQDPNVHISTNTKKNVFHQPVDQSIKPTPPQGVSELLPFHINAAGGDSEDRYQCMVAGSNGWSANHGFWNKGQIDRAAFNITPYSMGFYQRSDLPFHYSLADAYTIADSYHESIIAETNPNRMSWGGSTNGILQAQQGKNGPALDNNMSPGCVTSPQGFKYSCWPYEWKTVAEYLEDTGISWQVYQDEDNFEDNPFQSFKNFVDAAPGTPLAEKGMASIGLNKFYSDARSGSLPQVSFIIGPTDLSEHPPYGPLDGAWLQENVVNSVIQGKGYANSALIISYDETGGWADHVISPLPPANTPGEYILDFYNASLGVQPNGPGFRVPMVVVSPWSRGGNVFTEIGSHESQILFLEKWAEAKGKPFKSAEMTEWRREQLSDLTKAFDFGKKDLSIPTFAPTRAPSTDPTTGDYNGGPVCQAKYPNHQPSIPYGKQSESNSLIVESGYKKLMGNPSEGRYLVFEMNGFALSFQQSSKTLTMNPSTSNHNDPSQRFVIHAVQDTPSNNLFTISPASSSSSYLTSQLTWTTNQQDAAQYQIIDQGNGKGYLITEESSKKSLTINDNHSPLLQTSTDGQTLPFSFQIFSVSG